MAKQFLTFRLDNNQYAVEVHKVQEVLEYKHITKIPCAANYVEGLISSRIPSRGRNTVPAIKSANAPLSILMMIKSAVPSVEKRENTILTRNTISRIRAGREKIRSYHPIHQTKAISNADR